MDLLEWLGTILAAAVVLVAGFFIFRYLKNASPDTQAADGAPMPPIARRVLVGYLLVVGIGLVYSLVVISSGQFPPGDLAFEGTTEGVSAPTAASTQATATTVAGGDTTSSAVPVEDGAFPQPNPDNPSALRVTVIGRNFQPGSKVRFNREAAATKVKVDGTVLEADLDESHSSSGYVAVDVANADSLISNSVVVKIGKPKARIHLLFWHLLITTETQLLLLALLAGAIGSYVHALQSLGDFIGNRTLTASWFWWYIIRPFLGMAMALIFYAVLRGGFLAGTPGEAKAVNPFGVIAVGTLVGMFSDKATKKLADIFDTLFQSADDRSGKLTAPVIDTLDPAEITAGETANLTLRINGKRLGKVTTVTINNDKRQPDQVTEQQVTLTLKATDVAAPGIIAVAVIDPDTGASPEVTLTVKSASTTSQGQ